MNKIQRLLQEHCPNGVEWKPLGEVTEYEQPTAYLVKSTNYKDAYSTPVLTAGKTFILGYTDETDGIYQASLHTVIIFDDFTTAHKWVDFDFKAKSSAMKMIISKDESQVLLRYIYHWLNTLPSELAEGDHKRQWISNFSNKKIPLPPLPIQEEIVRILDKFTTLEAELEAELEARKKQYEYYKDNLLTFGDEAEWKALGEVGAFVRGSGLQKIDLTTSGIPAIHYGQIYTYYGVSVEQTISFVTPKTANGLKKVDYGDVIITNTSENLEDVGKAVFYSVKEQGVTGGHATIFKPSKEIIGKYLVYYTQTAEFSNQKRKYAKGTKVIDVSANDLAKITVPIPYPNDTKKSLEEQYRIVSILDKFDTLTHSISEGLPKEIALRRKQYEYYREQLLSFPKR